MAYRGRTYAATVEALACLLTFAGGVLLLRAPREVRFGYSFSWEFGALIIAGAVYPRGAGLWQAIYLGAFLAALVWLVCGTLKWLRELPRRVTRPRAPMPPPPIPPSPAAPPPAA